MALYMIDPVGRQFKQILCMVGWWTIIGRPCHSELHSAKWIQWGGNSNRFCAWWGGGQSKVGLVIQNGTLHNRSSGAAIQADSVHGGVVYTQRLALSYRIAFYIMNKVGLQFKPIMCMVGWWTIKGRPCHTEWHST